MGSDVGISKGSSIPIICQQGGAHRGSIANDDAPLRITPFVYVSDRDKGLKEAVKQVFPTNLEFSCAHTSNRDAEVWKKRMTSKYVMAIAKTDSARYMELLMDKANN